MSFYPDKPNKYSRIGKIMQLTGWKPRFTYWQYKTVCDYTDKGEGINRYCTDIRKSTVDRAFTQAFGYSSLLDPNGEGKAVIKSEENFAKDGRIISLPYRLKKGEVCQKVIDTFDGHFIDLRPVIVCGSFVSLIIKRKPVQFLDRRALFELVSPEDHFTQTEIKNIETFAAGIGMDYGELDFLRDKDGRGYIIDANKTPGGASKVEKLGEDFINAHKPLFL